MANPLDEKSENYNDAGQDARVIDKQIEVTVGKGSVAFEVMLWCLLIIPGLIFLIKKIQANNYFNKLSQRIQTASSSIDVELQKRQATLMQEADLVNKYTNHEKDIQLGVATARSGNPVGGNKNEVANQLDVTQQKINVALERYPDLKNNELIADSMQQNRYLEEEITAARGEYNDLVTQWNTRIMEWPVKKIVAAKNKYTTRIPFTAEQSVRKSAEQEHFFK